MKTFKRAATLLFVGIMATGLQAQENPTDSPQDEVMTTVRSDDWLMVTDAHLLVEMSQVGFIVSADTDDTFCVIGIDGSILADRVKRATFAAPGTEVIGIKVPDIIDNLQAIGAEQMLSYVVKEQLTLTGVRGSVTVYSLNGTAVAKGKNEKGTAVVNVSHLPQGVYIVRTGKQSFKFFKK